MASARVDRFHLMRELEGAIAAGQHTALTTKNIDNEVDRYINWPGQALGYKIGQLEILKLRQRAERELGDQFDIKAFHDAVLTTGAVSMPVLRERIDAYITEAQR